MVWKETCPVEERLKFVMECLSEEPNSLAALCRKYDISRKTGYKWLERYEPGDPRSLEDRSRRPWSSPHETERELVEAVLEVRRERPVWGPKKILWKLGKLFPEASLPSKSTIANILKRHGLVRDRPRREKVPRFTAPFAATNAPNDTWCADFKGHFQTGLRRCHPLTVSDSFSRFLLRCDALRMPRYELSRPVFESAFREFGLPGAMRTDNGPPFASTSVGGLTKLSVWWMRLGICVERIVPGHPEQNGRHERMHRTLKEETADPPTDSLRAQQKRFDIFRGYFNNDRPHEALGQTTPASCYEPSPRPYPARLPPVEYPADFYAYRVPHNGVLPWRGHNLYISTCLANEYIGINHVDEQKWEVHFCSTLLGTIDRDPKTPKRYVFTRETHVARDVVDGASISDIENKGCLENDPNPRLLRDRTTVAQDVVDDALFSDIENK